MTVGPPTGGRFVAPGWYWDPGAPGQERYWDGTHWTGHARRAGIPITGPGPNTGGWATPTPIPTPISTPTTIPAAGTGAADGKGKGRKGKLITSGGVVVVVLVGVVLWAIFHNHQQPSEVSFAGLGSISFNQNGQNATDSTQLAQLQQSQSTIEQQLAALRQQAQSSGQSDAQPAVNISGTWSSSDGFSYQIEQFGGNAVIAEECSCGGITAYGEGQFNGAVFAFDYAAYNGSTGEGQLTLSDSNTLTGAFHNDSSGGTVPVRLTR